LLVIFKYNKDRKIYIALILFANDVPAARKICNHASHIVKCYHCPKHLKYDPDTKKSTIMNKYEQYIKDTE
ncbi:23742_t:CDS:2, partial [Cetraspora pellucida]